MTEELEHAGVKGMKWGKRKSSYQTSVRKNAQTRIDHYGGSKGKAAAITIGKGLAIGIVANAGTMALSAMTPNSLQPGISAASSLFNIGNVVNTAYNTAAVIGTDTKK